MTARAFGLVVIEILIQIVGVVISWARHHSPFAAVGRYPHFLPTAPDNRARASAGAGGCACLLAW
jgi:hypothetical protein